MRCAQGARYKIDQTQNALCERFAFLYVPIRTPTYTTDNTCECIVRVFRVPTCRVLVVTVQGSRTIVEKRRRAILW